jgi:hypothetical protein
VRQQQVLVGQVRIGMERHSAHFILPLERGAVEGLDVLQDVIEMETRRVHLAGSDPEMHEGVIGIRAVRNGDLRGFVADLHRVLRVLRGFVADPLRVLRGFVADPLRVLRGFVADPLRVLRGFVADLSRPSWLRGRVRG